MTQYVGLIDCNNFFVSCERLFRPDLEKKPVLVLSSNDGCVVARSQEVKDIGIPMGVPYFKIKDIIKDNNITIFSGNITLYRDVSRRVFSIVRDEFTVQEQYSIDEAFFTLPAESDVLATVNRVRDRVGQEVGIPVSIGVASSKTRAKYAATLAKKHAGCFLVTEEVWQQECKHISLAHIWGVGRRLAERYRSAGLLTVFDLMTADSARVEQLFGVAGLRHQSELKGEYTLKVEHKRPLQKSLMSSRSFSKKTTDFAVLSDALAYHVRHVAADLRAMDAIASSLRVSLGTSRHGDFLLRGGSKEVCFDESTSDTFVFMRQAQLLLRDLYESDVPYQKVGVVVSGIRSNTLLSQSLFTDDATASPTELLSVIDKLNTVTGKELVLFGSRLKTKEWQAKAAERSAAYTTRWGDIASVSAK